MEGHAKLRQYLDLHRLTVRRFCQLSGLSYSTIYRYLQVGGRPRRLGVLKLRDATHGFIRLGTYGYDEAE